MSKNSVLSITVVALATLALLSFFVLPADDFSPYNPRWNGYSELREKWRARIIGIDVSTEEMLSSPRNYTLLVVPYREPSPRQMSFMAAFTSLGGNLVVLDDRGAGNDILESLGVDAILDHNGTLFDPVFFDKDYRLPHVFPQRLNKTLYIVANYASIVRLGPGCRRVLSTSKLAFFDKNMDGIWQPGEPAGSLAVGGACKLIDGKVYVFSDPDLLNNYAVRHSNATYILDIVSRNRTLVIYYDLYPKSPYSYLYYLSEKVAKLAADNIFEIASLLTVIVTLILAKTFPWGRK